MHTIDGLFLLGFLVGLTAMLLFSKAIRTIVWESLSHPRTHSRIERTGNTIEVRHLRRDGAPKEKPTDPAAEASETAAKCAHTEASNGGNPPPVDVPVSFKTVFWVVLALSVLSLLIAVYLATRPAGTQTPAVQDLIQTCDTTWKMGFAGLLGLLGGKRLT